MSARTLFICWKWKDLDAPDGALQDTFQVADDPDARLVRMHQRARVDQIVDWLRTDSAQNASEYLLLLHISHFSANDAEQLSNDVAQLNIPAALVRFGGGGDYIYYNPVSKTGLLDQEQGVFADAVDAKIAIRDANGHILSERFNPLWRRYKFNLKQRLEKQSVLMYRTLDTQLFKGQTGTAHGLLTAHKPAYVAELDACKSILTQHYTGEQQVMEPAHEFWDKLHYLTIATAADLQVLQAPLNHLLSQL